MTEPVSEITKLSERSRAILRQLVESYLTTGEPVGSRNLSRVLPMSLSPASIRNVMADLEQAGLIYAPHTSAGRLPTQSGLRLFVDGLLEVGHLADEERRQIEAQISVQRTEVDRPGADGGRRDDLGPLPLRWRRARREAGRATEAHRVRAARADQGARGPGRRGPERREPRHLAAAGAAALGADGSRATTSMPTSAA